MWVLNRNIDGINNRHWGFGLRMIPVKNCLFTLQDANIIVGLVTNVLSIRPIDYTMPFPGLERFNATSYSDLFHHF